MQIEHTLSHILETYRNREGLNLREMEERVGLSFSYLGKIERGSSVPAQATLVQLALKMGESPYRLLVAAGYQVNLKKDFIVKDVKLTDDQLKKVMKNYRIYAIGNFETWVTFRGLKKSFISYLSGDYQKYKNIRDGLVPLTLDEATDICLFISAKFTDVFKVVKDDYDNVTVGDLDDGEVAFQIDKYINKKKSEQKFSIEMLRSEEPTLVAEEVTMYKPVIEMLKDSKTEFDVLDEELTLDEVIYLRECLDLYRRLKLGPSK